MTTFASLGLAPEILKAITGLGFETPTPVQAKVIPLLLESSEDLVALAQTGTGKTAAFGLPLLQQIDTSTRHTHALVLCPTRELCLQICRDLKQFSKYVRGLRTVAIYGGAPIVNQLRALENGVHLIVATPGRMHDILRRGKADLSSVRWTVLDEADEMLNMGFEEDLKAILGHVTDQSQTLLFSATMPKQIEAIAGDYMHSPREITIGTRNVGAENVHHECYMVHARDRYLALKRLVDYYPGMYGLVFCRTRAETQDIAAKLIKDGYNADALHGDLSQQQRDRVMDKFRERSIQMLVATDVAARGLDINDLTHVINYQLPDDLESYTHRSGRTGRAGKEGVSVVLIHMREKFKIRHIEKRLGKRFEYKQVPSGDEVCEAQLYHLIARAKDVAVDDSQIDPYLDTINEMLRDMPPEEIVKRFVSLEFNRFLAYYHSAPDLNVQERAPRQRIGGESASSLFINVGKLDRFTPRDLMGLINRGTRGDAIQVGRIDIKEKCSFFDVSADDQDIVMQALSGASFANRELRVEPAGGKQRQGNRRPARSPGKPGAQRRPHRSKPPARPSAKPQRAAPRKKKRQQDDDPTPPWARKVAKRKPRRKK